MFLFPQSSGNMCLVLKLQCSSITIETLKPYYFFTTLGKLKPAKNKIGIVVVAPLIECNSLLTSLTQKDYLTH